MWNRMVGNPRSELVSGSTEIHCNGLRTSYSGGVLERSGSFREGVSSAGSNRNTSQGSQGEIPPPSQFLLLDFISLGDQKYPRAGELRRAVGISLEDHSFSGAQSKNLTSAAAEELKRFKASISETSSKARDRSRLLHESISKLDHYRGLISRKRQRAEIASGEKPGNGSIMKTGNQLHQCPSDLPSPRLDERTKNLVPNKRMRTSMAEADGRGVVVQNKDKNAPIDKEKNMLRACNGLMPVEEKLRVLPGGEGWEKKMKRKRSVGPAGTRQMDSDREFKPSLQPRLNAESCGPRDGLPFRQASSGSLKSDNSPQCNGSGNRLIPRADFENASLMNDRKERGLLPKGGNKSNIREDSPIGSQTSLTKKVSRGPRSGPSTVMNMPSGIQRSPGSINGWDQASHMNKIPCRKNSFPPMPSSPPMGQWGNQRLPKNTRTRRTNLLPPTINQESPVLTEGVSSDIIRSYKKPKTDGVLSPATASESEERILNSSDMEDGDVSALNKATNLLLHSKNKPPRCEMVNGVRKPGRTGRGLGNQKAAAQLSKEKLDTLDASRPMRVGRPGSEISKGGRPPSKKASERKSFGRPSLSLNNGSSEIPGDQDDDHNELSIAADYARNISDHCCSSSFWKNVEEMFSFTSEDPVRYLKEQINLLEEVNERKNESKQKFLDNDIPLSQRLLAAFIEEDDMCHAGIGPESEHDLELNFIGLGSCNGYGNHCDEHDMDVSCFASESQHAQRCLDDKIMMELRYVGLFDDTAPELMNGEESDVHEMIEACRGNLYDKLKYKKVCLLQLDEAIQKSRDVDKKRTEKIAMDKLVEMAYKKYLGGKGQKGGVNRISKQAALSFAKRVLDRCRKYEATGASCFTDLLVNAESTPVDQSQRLEASPAPEPDHPNRPKKREVLLEEVAGASPVCPPGGSSSFAGATKGKRSETRNPKTNRPCGPRGERKTKVKPQQNVQLSPPRGGNPENPPREPETAVGFPNLSLDAIPMDGLDVQGQDIGSWLSIVDDEGLHDNDLMMGLEIPMDDLSEINMNF